MIRHVHVGTICRYTVRSRRDQIHSEYFDHLATEPLRALVDGFAVERATCDVDERRRGDARHGAEHLETVDDAHVPTLLRSGRCSPAHELKSACYAEGDG